MDTALPKYQEEKTEKEDPLPKEEKGKANVDASKKKTKFKKKGKGRLPNAGPKSTVLNEDHAEFKLMLERLNISLQMRAIQLSTTTRGIGFATAAFYTRVITTWNLQSVAPICNILQCYRVHLYLFYYKMYLAAQEQNESRASNVAIENINLTSSMISVLSQLVELPCVFVAVLQSVGKIVINDEVYHSVIQAAPAENDANYIQYLASVQTPNNVRTLLDYLAQVANPVANRMFLIERLCIPGCRIIGNLLQNADEVWPPNYNVDSLRNDVHAYRNLITRVQNRLPKSFLMHYPVKGFGTASGLLSTSMSTMRMRTVFRAAGTSLRSGLARRTTVDAHLERVEIIGAERTSWWSRNVLSNEELLIGAAAMTGEEVQINTRYSCVSIQSAKLNSLDVMYAINDAPRP